MIDNQLIESAKNIRKTFLRMTNQLSVYETEVKDLINFLQEKIQILQNYNNNDVRKMKTNEDLNKVTKSILKEIEEIEAAEQKLQNKIGKINKEIEKLSNEEVILYKTIKERYPNLSDVEIKREIQQNLRF